MATDHRHAPLAAVLADFRPRDAAESADLDRTRGLLDRADPWDRTTPLHATASAIVVHPPTARVLLRWHPRMESWLQVGGHADPGEHEPLAIAAREGREEAGLGDLTPWPTPYLLHVVVVSVPATNDEPAHEHADLRFVLATETPDAARPEKAAAPVRWLSLPDAQALSSEDNLRETLGRVAPLLEECH